MQNESREVLSAAKSSERPLVCLVHEAGLAAVAAELRLEIGSLTPETADAVARGAAGLYLAGYGPRLTRTRGFAPASKEDAQASRTLALRRQKRSSSRASAI